MSTQPIGAVVPRTRKIAERVLFGIGVLWIIALFVCGFLAYLVTRREPSGWVDGLGRPLTEAPMLARIFFGQERLWPGWSWFAIDLVVFWGSLALVSFIFGRRGSK